VPSLARFSFSVIAPTLIVQFASGAASWVPATLAVVLSGFGHEVALPATIVAIAARTVAPAALGLISVTVATLNEPGQGRASSRDDPGRRRRGSASMHHYDVLEPSVAAGGVGSDRLSAETFGVTPDPGSAITDRRHPGSPTMNPAQMSARSPQVIEVRDLSKSYDGKLVIDHLSFAVQPGRVSGFLGPNGAGKSTTMRLIVGLDRPTGGDATIGGIHYADLPRPLRVVGALLDAGAAHKGRSAFDHLLVLAQTQGIPRQRVDEVLELVGLHDVAHERAGTFSLGMGQRLGLAAALIGDPQVLILDEPVNGLDPDGIMWIRNLVIHLAGEGRTILISSHLMSEMAATASDLIVIGRGRLIAACTTDEFIERSSKRSVLVVSPDAVALTDLIAAAGGHVDVDAEGALIVRLIDAAHIGALASHAGLELHELTPQLASLEDAFMEQTHTSTEFGGHNAAGDREAAMPGARS